MQISLLGSANKICNVCLPELLGDIVGPIADDVAEYAFVVASVIWSKWAAICNTYFIFIIVCFLTNVDVGVLNILLIILVFFFINFIYL